MKTTMQEYTMNEIKDIINSEKFKNTSCCLTEECKDCFLNLGIIITKGEVRSLCDILVDPTDVRHKHIYDAINHVLDMATDYKSNKDLCNRIIEHLILQGYDCQEV